MAREKLQRSLIDKRTEKIESLSDALAKRIADSEGILHRSITKRFVSRLEVDKAGNIINGPANKRLVAQLDSIYADFVEREGAGIVSEIVGGVRDMMTLNKEYYTGFASEKTIDQIANGLQSEVFEMLGLNKSGGMAKGGYLEVLISDHTVSAKIKNQALRAIVTKQNKERYRENLDRFVRGDENRLGVLRDFHKETSMDIVSQTDRLVSKGYADSLGLRFAIYEGNIVAKTRDFCRRHAGKVYHISEILKFNPTVAVPPNYNPLLDLGGYNCRHHYNWISDELAVELRPAAIKFIKNKTQ